MLVSFCSLIVICPECVMGLWPLKLMKKRLLFINQSSRKGGPRLCHPSAAEDLH